MLVELSTELREATQNPSTHLNGAVGLGGLDPGQEVLQLGGREAVLRVAAAERGEVRRYGREEVTEYRYWTEIGK